VLDARGMSARLRRFLPPGTGQAVEFIEFSAPRALAVRMT
jgi:hypothetical protein